MDEMELAYLAFKKLAMRFENKIDHDEYYLSYSGGMDSHLLLWFIRTMEYDIKVVAVNTFREHNEIRKRMYDNADVVLYPTKKMKDIKEKYGMPCFTKFQDDIIRRYQSGSRARYTLDIVNGVGAGTGKFKLNNTAKSMLLSDQLHKVSSECCKYTKKEPLKKFEKETGLKPIIAVRISDRSMSSAPCTSLPNVLLS